METIRKEVLATKPDGKGATTWKRVTLSYLGCTVPVRTGLLMISQRRQHFYKAEAFWTAVSKASKEEIEF